MFSLPAINICNGEKETNTLQSHSQQVCALVTSKADLTTLHYLQPVPFLSFQQLNIHQMHQEDETPAGIRAGTCRIIVIAGRSTVLRRSVTMQANEHKIFKTERLVHPIICLGAVGSQGE